MKRTWIPLIFLGSLIICIGVVGKNFTDLSLDRNKQSTGAVAREVKSDLDNSNAPDLYTLDTGKQIPIMEAEGSFRDIKSFKELVDSSDVVVIGKPLSSIEDSEIVLSVNEETNELAGAFSTTPVNIEIALKGSFRSGDTINMGQSVAILNRAEIPVPKAISHITSNTENSDEILLLNLAGENYSPVKRGSSYILFLKRGLAHGSNVYFHNGSTLGRINVDGTDEISHERPIENKIKQYAKKAFREAQRNPNSDVLAAVVAESVGDFPTVPEDPNIESLPENIPNVGVVTDRQRNRTLPSISRRNPRSLQNPGSIRRNQP